MNHSAPTSVEATSHSEPKLARTMGLAALTIYGVGDMLGSGVYALIGKAAGTMGNAVWLAFLASMMAALLTGLSYASLGSRYPRAAGVSYISYRAFGFPFLSYIVGLAVVASGLTSFATQSRSFTGYFLGMMGQSLPGATDTTLPNASSTVVIAIIIGFIAVLTFINFWGMKESTALNALCTFIEVAGLAIVVFVGMRYLGAVDYLQVPAVQSPTGAEVAGALTAGLVFQGAVLTFYSFVGFEDMINVTEEVKEPEKNFPKAVVMALTITTVIYILISLVAVSVVSYQKLGTSNQPLVDVVVTAAPWFPPALFSLIALFAITNTGLLNYIMGSRLIYGMARQGFVPRALGEVHPTRRTPHKAILVLMVIVLALALQGNIKQLASATSVLLLSVFVIVNASLIVLQRRPDEPKGQFEIPSFVPFCGILVCLTMLYNVKPDKDALDPRLIGLMLLGAIALLYAIMRPKNISEETLADSA